jgi:biotin carboxylase
MRILLLDEGQHQSLYLSRKLQEYTAPQENIHVAIASSKMRRQMYGVFPVTFFAVPPPSAANYADRITAIAKDFDHIIPISNNCLPVAYNTKTTWSHKVFPPLPTESFMVLFDKFASTQLAKKSGINCPDFIEIEKADDLHQAINRFGLPIVLKQHTGWAGTGVHICHSTEELIKNFYLFHIQGKEKIFCQQYIEGTPCLAGGLFLNGEALRIYCADHTFNYPPITGSSKSLISRHDSDMENTLITFCRAVNWTGLGNLDFIRGNDGKLYFLEMNPRIWGSIAASEDAGVNLIEPLVKIMRKEKPTPILTYEDNVHSALFPQYILTLCQQGGYKNLWRAASERWLWSKAPWTTPRYMLGYMIKFSHAWLHGLKRTVKLTVGLTNKEEALN